MLQTWQCSGKEKQLATVKTLSSDSLSSFKKNTNPGKGPTGREVRTVGAHWALQHMFNSRTTDCRVSHFTVFITPDSTTSAFTVYISCVRIKKYTCLALSKRHTMIITCTKSLRKSSTKYATLCMNIFSGPKTAEYTSQIPK